RHERHHEHEDRGGDRGPDVVHHGDGGRRRMQHLHGFESIELVIMGQWPKGQYSKEFSQSAGGLISWPWSPSMASCLATSRRPARCSAGWATATDRRSTTFASAVFGRPSNRGTSASRFRID